jgi:cyanate lyase
MTDRKTTEFGKLLRKLRIDHDHKLVDMAEKVGRAPSFVSAIEFGKKPASTDFVDAIVRAYKLDEDDAEELHVAAARGRKEISMRPAHQEGRDMASMLARKIDTLTPDQISDIQKILKRV